MERENLAQIETGHDQSYNEFFPSSEYHLSLQALEATAFELKVPWLSGRAFYMSDASLTTIHPNSASNFASSATDFFQPMQHLKLPQERHVRDGDPFLSNDLYSEMLLFKGGGNGGKGGQKNFAPVAQDHDFTIAEDAVLSFSLLDGATDKNGDPLFVTSVAGEVIADGEWITLPSGARYQVRRDGSFDYDPNGAFDILEDGETAVEELSFTISDGSGGSATGLLTTTITGVTEAVSTNPPDAVNDWEEVTSGSSAVFDVLANDDSPNGAALSIIEIDGTSISPGGTLQLSSGSTVTLTQEQMLEFASASGTTESFSYTIVDTEGLTDTATVSVSLLEEVPYYIEAILAPEGQRLNAPEPVGTSATVTYSFTDTLPWYYPSGFFDEVKGFSAQQEEAARAMLQSISDFSGLTFVEVEDGIGEIVFGIAQLGGTTRGSAFAPNSSTSGYVDSDVWIDLDVAGDTFDPGTLGYLTLLHETGHAIGLSHPDLDLLSGEEATQKYTVMAYAPNPETDLEPDTYLEYDVAALQYLYGA